MSDTLLSDLPQTICNEIATRLPELKRCKPHAGKFSLEELKRKGLPSPSVLVSALGAKQDVTYAGSATSFILQMAAYVVVKDGLGAPRDVRAGNICQVLLSIIPHNRWGSDGYGEARSVRMHTLVSTKTKDHGVSLWAVTWEQPISFFAPADLPLGVELYVGLAPDIGLENEDQYERIGGEADV